MHNLLKNLTTLSVVLLSGCAVFYQESVIVSEKGFANIQMINECTVEYLISGIPENAQFKNGPELNEYSQWVKGAIHEIGCTGSEVKEIGQHTLYIQVIDNHVYRDAGVGILLALTLYIIPMKDIPSPHRTYLISYGEKEQTVKVTNNAWYGWVFLPFHPLSYWNYEKGIFQETIEEFLTKRET